MSFTLTFSLVPLSISGSSDIVREARQQHIMRPKILKEAAAKHNLFLAEDGSVLEIYDDEKSPKKKRAKKGEDVDENGNSDGVKKKVCEKDFLPNDIDVVCF